MIAVGIDACAGGWVAVALVDGRVDRVWSGPALPVLLADVASEAIVGIDLPLGGVERGWRTADLAARRRLGARHASVFAVPPRPVWDATTYDVANARCRALTGQGLSRQAYGLLSRMLEAEAYRDASPHPVHEVHPELVFGELASRTFGPGGELASRTFGPGGELASRTSKQDPALAGAPRLDGKRTWNGQMARRALLARAGVVLADHLPLVRVPADDVLDAAAVAWCAQRIATGEASRVPDPPDQHDHRGRPIVIWTG